MLLALASQYALVSDGSRALPASRVVARCSTPTAAVASWYDQGVRLSGEEVKSAAPANPASAEQAEFKLTQAFLRARAKDGYRAELIELGLAIEAAEEAGVDMKSDTIRQAQEYVESKGGVLMQVAQVTVVAGQAAEKLKEVAPISDDERVAKDVGNAVGLLAGAGAVAALGLDLASIDLDILAVGLGIGAAVAAEEDKGV